MCNGKEEINVSVLFYCCIKLNLNIDTVVKSVSILDNKSINDFYREFSQIRLKRDYQQLPSFYDSLRSQNSEDLSSLMNHVQGIICATKEEYALAVDFLSISYEDLGSTLAYENLGDLSLEHIEILIDYSLCLFFLGDCRWELFLTYLYDENNNYASQDIIDYIYPKICYNLSFIYLRDNNYNQSLQVSEKGVAFAIEKNNFLLAGFLYYNLAISHACLGNTTLSSSALDRSKDIFTIQNRQDTFHNAYKNDHKLYFSNMPIQNQ